MALPIPTPAVETLRERVRKPAFLEKLARDWNIHPRNHVEVNQLVTLAAELRAAQTRNQVKAASDGNPFLANAIDGLRNALRQEGQPTGPTSYEQLLKQAADQRVSQDKDVAQAALAYADYLANLEQ
jgi:hypothetical protein